MGINSLWAFIQKHNVGCTEIKWKDFKGKRIAIEANNLAYKYKYGNQPDSLFQQFALLIADCWEVGVESVIVVMDGGDYPMLKQNTRIKRQKEIQKSKEHAQKVEELLFSCTIPNEILDDETIKMVSPQFFTNLKKKADALTCPVPLIIEPSSTEPQSEIVVPDVKTEQSVKPTKEEWIEEEKKKWTKEEFLRKVYEAKQKISPVTSKDYENLGQMLALMGVITINADGEGESFCASLCQMGIVDWVISEDSDLFAFGATKIVRDVSWASKRKDSFRLFDVNQISTHLGIQPRDWIPICVLCQNDYNKDGCRVAGIGIANAYKEIKSGKQWEEIMKSKHAALVGKKRKQTEDESSTTPDFSIEEILEKHRQIFDYFASYWVHEGFDDRQKKNVEDWLLSFKRRPDFEGFCQFWDMRQKSTQFIPNISKIWQTVYKTLESKPEDVPSFFDDQHSSNDSHSFHEEEIQSNFEQEMEHIE